MRLSPDPVKALIPPRGARLWRLMPVLAFLFLTACVLDREKTVRAQLDGWLVLGDTIYFNSTRNCTAGVFDTRASSVLSGAKKVRSVDRGLRLIDQEQAVAFDMATLSPAQLYDQIDAVHRPVSLRILVSGLAAKDCFTQTQNAAFSDALNTANVILVYDPENAAMALFDRARKQVFYTRAEL